MKIQFYLTFFISVYSFLTIGQDKEEKSICSAKTISYVDPDYRLKYRGSMYAIRKEFHDKFPEQNFLNINQNSGIITIQFNITCEAKTIISKVQSVDFDYKEIEMNKDLIKELTNIVMGLKDWEIKFLKNSEIGKQAAFLTFKIENGKIIDIMPFY